MIRHATPDDAENLKVLLRTAGLNAVEKYTYRDLDGPCLVDDHQGELRGAIRFWLGKPETWIRQLAVLPQYRGTPIAAHLMLAVGKLAIEYGSEGVEGFQGYEIPGLTWLCQRGGAVLHAGTRVRWFADHPMWRQAALSTTVGVSPSTTTSPST